MELSTLQNVHTGSGALSTPISWYSGHFPRGGGGWSGLEVRLTTHFIAVNEVKTEWNFASAPSISLHDLYRDNFICIPLPYAHFVTEQAMFDVLLTGRRMIVMR